MSTNARESSRILLNAKKTLRLPGEVQNGGGQFFAVKIRLQIKMKRSSVMNLASGGRWCAPALSTYLSDKNHNTSLPRIFHSRHLAMHPLPQEPSPISFASPAYSLLQCDQRVLKKAQGRPLWKHICHRWLSPCSRESTHPSFTCDSHLHNRTMSIAPLQR